MRRLTSPMKGMLRSASSPTTFSRHHLHLQSNTMDSLPDCPLLTKLPAEVRRCIFEMFYTEAVVFDADEHVHPHRVQLERKDLLNLPLTCKQIHAESLPFLDKNRVCFAFRNPLALFLFAERTQHLESVTAIRLDTIDHRTPYPEESFWRWLRACSILEKLPRLQRLSVNVYPDTISPEGHRVRKRHRFRPKDLWPWKGKRIWIHAPCEPRWYAVFDPLLRISAPVEFDVYIRWKQPELPAVNAPTPLSFDLPTPLSFSKPTPFRVWFDGERVQ